ncbi:MAG: thiolase family protein [Verrucomicrobiota bacterium]
METKKKQMVIVDGVRTPFCRMGTDLADMKAQELGRIAVNALLTKTGYDPGKIDEVIFGCVAQPVDAANVSRVIALNSGIPKEVPASTVHRNCASGLEALFAAYEKMCAGRGDVFVVGGVESMSNIPFLWNKSAVGKFTQLAKSRTLSQRLKTFLSFRSKDFSPVIGLRLGLTDPVSGLNMGETAENLSRDFDITREEQDAFAQASQQKAAAATEKFASEICPVFLSGKNAKAVTQDNGVRANSALEKLAQLKPVFQKKHGTVTAGNASQVTDGAVALLVMSEEAAARFGYEPLGLLKDYHNAGCDPSRMGMGPVHAIHGLVEKSTLELEAVDIVEINEAFAVQVLAVMRGLESVDYCQKYLNKKEAVACIPMEKINVNGGSIALGHPVGATGARLVLTSLYELKRRQAKTALVSLCIGGGQGAAAWLESI